jgi:hypothetical protein
VGHVFSPQTVVGHDPHGVPRQPRFRSPRKAERAYTAAGYHEIRGVESEYVYLYFGDFAHRGLS